MIADYESQLKDELERLIAEKAECEDTLDQEKQNSIAQKADYE